MSLSASLFGRDSFIHKATNILGLGIPGWLDRKFGGQDTPAIRSLGELAEQTAREAEPRNIFFGCVRPIGGNIIHCQAPVTKWVETEVDGGGKGGGKKKQKQSTQHVYRTYAIGVGEQVTGYRRIWRNNKLVYDARGNAWGEENNPIFLRSFVLYNGGWDQMPDPTLESIWGVGQVPAYRGTSYMVSINEDLTDLGGAVPQWIFEVVRAEGTFLTSKPYSLEAIDGFDSAGAGIRSLPTVNGVTDGFDSSSAGLLSGVHRTSFSTYDNWPPENLDSTDAGILSGVHRATIASYDNWPPENLDSTDAGILSGVHRIGLIEYTNWPPENLDSTDAGLLSGVHNG